MENANEWYGEGEVEYVLKRAEGYGLDLEWYRLNTDNFPAEILKNASHPDIDIFTLERDLDFLDNPDRFEEELGEWLVPGMSQWQGRYGDCDEDDEL